MDFFSHSWAHLYRTTRRYTLSYGHRQPHFKLLYKMRQIYLALINDLSPNNVVDNVNELRRKRVAIS